MKKTLATIFALIMLLGGQSAFAQGENQTPTEKAIQGVKDTVGALIDAKDKNDPKEPEVKLETYKKVLELALADAKDMKLKLLAFDMSDNSTGTSALWQKDRVADLNDAIKHYEKEQIAADKEDISSDEVKALAEGLKKWRETTYSPLIEEVQGFLLIEQQKKSLDTATKRLEKVRSDVTKLKKAKFKGIKNLEDKFKNAEELIRTSNDRLNDAKKLFTKKYLLNYMNDSDAQKIALLKEIKEDKLKKETKKSDADASSPTQTSSIKDLIDDSFAKVKESYQIFIEMSGLVRKSL